jgi:hypothetical protein
MNKIKIGTKLSSKLTIEDYDNLLKDQEKSKQAIAEFVFERLTERYITPIKNVLVKYKNGFSIMANCCLLIETYQCFRLGLNDTNKRGLGEQVFKDFMDEEPEFIQLKGMGVLFYKNVRCGILHQGETKKGWTISRKTSDPLFDSKQLKINANLFIEALSKTLERYKDELIKEDWSAGIWENCRDKIEFIKNNC